MTDGSPRAFAVADGRITAVGDTGTLRERFPEAEVIDFGKSVIAPGFNDAHIHLCMAAENLLYLDLSPEAVRSLNDLKARIAVETEASVAGTWIRGSRYDDSRCAGGEKLTRWHLDEAAPEHPVLVVHVAGHWGVTNSAGLARGALDDGSMPPSGGEYGRDASGRLNGVLYEQALFDFAYPSIASSGTSVVPVPAFEDRLAALRRAMKMFNACGLTSVCDALVGSEEAALLGEAERRGLLTVRVNALVAAESYESVHRSGVFDRCDADFLRFNGIKTFVDGAVGGRTCLLEEPFEGTSDDYGIQTRSTAELRDVVRLAFDRQLRLCVHANGDRAINLILSLMEEARAAGLHKLSGDRIEHCSIVTGDILRRMRDLDAIAVPFGSYAYYHGERLLEWYGRNRVGRMFAHRSFLDAGVRVAGSSDFPCGPYEPLLGMQSCATRRGWDGAVVGENQRISAIEALSLYTTRAASSTGEHRSKGMLSPGYWADFVVLDSDPLSRDVFHLSDIAVRQTYVAGRRVWPDTDSDSIGDT